jgi:hypothetical protein
MPQNEFEDGSGHDLVKSGAPTRLRPVDANYKVEPELVAEALLRRIDQLAEDRAQYRRALIHSVEVIEAPGDSDAPTLF